MANQRIRNSLVRKSSSLRFKRTERCSANMSDDDISSYNGSSTGDFEPRDCDIVCGRGKGSYNRPGNRVMLEIIKEHISDYQACDSKPDKSAILKTIRDKLIQEGRKFVKRGSAGQWVIMDNKEAKEKIGHAMREAIAPSRRPKASPSVMKKAKSTLKRVPSFRRSKEPTSIPSTVPLNGLHESILLNLRRGSAALFEDLMCQDLLSSEMLNSSDFVLSKSAVILFMSLIENFPLYIYTCPKKCPTYMYKKDHTNVLLSLIRKVQKIV